MSTSTLREEKESSLLDRTRKLLQDTELTYLKIYSDTKIPPHWLSDVASGKTTNPSVNRVQRLYEYLSGKELGV